MSSDQPHIVVAESYGAAAVERLRSVGRVTLLPDGLTDGGLPADCHALLIRTRTVISRDDLMRAPQLRVIGRAGVGLDNVDLPAAHERGVRVVHTPEASTTAVAELTVGLVIVLLRQLPYYDAAVRAGRFEEARNIATAELSGLTLGVVGMGRIGRAAGRRLREGFGMRILYHDIVDKGYLPFVAERVPFERLLAEADAVTLHVPLTAQTRGLIGRQTIAQMKAGAALVNTSRGAVVDMDALAEALQTGRLGGAGLDVFDPEPPPADHPILHAPHTLLTPHVGARTQPALAAMEAVVEDVIAVLEGRQPRFEAVYQQACGQQ